MNFFELSSILISISSIVIAVFVLKQASKQKTAVILAFFCSGVALWGISGYGFSSAATKEAAFFWWQIAYISVILSNVVFVHFVVTFLQINRKKFIVSAYILAGIFILIELFAKETFFGDLSFSFNQFYYLDWFSRKRPLYLLFYIIFYWGFLIYAFSFLIKHYVHAKGIKREQLKYFILGSIIGWMGPYGDFMPVFRIDIYPYTNILVAIYPAIWAYAIIKYQLLDIKVAITRVGIFLTLYTVVLGIPFVIGLKTQSWIWSTSSAVLLATMGPLIYRALQVKAEDILLSEQRRYQKILVQAASGMTQEHSLERLMALIVRIVKKAVRMEFAALFLEDKEKEAYIMRAIRTDTPVPEVISFKFTDPFIEFMKVHKEPFLFEEIPMAVKNTIKFPLNIALIVPSFYDDSSIGFLVLGEKQNRKTYSVDDINVFKILSRQTSMSIENCIFVDEFKKAQERVFAAEKLASIGGLAEGVAHQINNRLNHFSMVSGELKFEVESFLENHKSDVETSPDLKKTFDYLMKISESLLTNVKRTDGILKGILNFAKVEARETLFSDFFLQEVIDLSIDLLKIKHGVQEFPLTVVKESSDVIFGVKSQIMETVYNLLDNAYEATLDKIGILSDDDVKTYVPSITVTVSQTPERCILQFVDNGIGIKSTDRHKIFAPFFTTKASTKSGTGIGMYVVRRMVEENHRGKISFESEYGKGTKITVELPRKYASSNS